MHSKNQNDLYKLFWQPLETILTTDEINDFFINFLNFKNVNNVTKDNGYDYFKYLFENEFNSQSELALETIYKYANYYSLFIGKENNGFSDQIFYFFKIFKTLKQTTLFIFLFSIFDDYKNGKIKNEETLIKILNLLIIYTIRRLVLEYRTNALRGMYKTLYKVIFKEEDKNDYYNKIYSYFADHKNKYLKLVNETDFIQGLISVNLYNKPKLTKLLLTILENENNKEKVTINEDITIEHILPQSKNSKEWKEMLNDEYEETYRTYLHTLGNLTLSGYNSNLSNKSFIEKKQQLKEKSKFKFLNEDIINSNIWNQQAIINRANKLATKLNEILTIQIPKNYIYKDDIIDNFDYDKWYFIEDADLVTEKKPLKVKILGNEQNVSSLRKLITVVVKVLTNFNKQKMLEIANNKIEGIANFISKDKESIRSTDCETIIENQIYLNKCISGRGIIILISKILDYYEIDHNQFSFQYKKIINY